MRRFLDYLLFCDCLLVMLSPVLILVLIVGWLDIRAPLFRQERVGRHSKAVCFGEHFSSHAIR